MITRAPFPLLCCLLLCAAPALAETLEERFDPPPGYERVEEAPGSFGDWMRALPLKPGRPDLHYWNGRRTRWQGGHEAVVEMDLGQRDLQQCADTVIRLRAEYLRSHGRDDEIWFRFTSGDTARWLDWSRGIRPRVRNNEVSWRRAAEPDDGSSCFGRYLYTVYTYAGTASLSRDLTVAPDTAGAGESREVGDGVAAFEAFAGSGLRPGYHLKRGRPPSAGPQPASRRIVRR